MLGSRKADVVRVSSRSQPSNERDQIRLCHGRTSSRRSSRSATNMEKDRASVTRHRRIGVVADLDPPAISEIPPPHLRLLVPRWRLFLVDFNILILVRATHV